MNTIDFEANKQRLLEEKAKISSLLGEHSGAFKRSVRAEPCDSLDEARERSEFLIEDSISSLEDQHLHAVDEALKRLISGVYGECAACSQPIAEERLATVPGATLCVQCQKQREQYGPPRLLSA